MILSFLIKALKGLFFGLLSAGIVYFLGGLIFWLVTLQFIPSYIILPTIFGGICRIIVALFFLGGLIGSYGE